MQLSFGMYFVSVHHILLTLSLQGSNKCGKPGILRQFCKPGKVREFEIWTIFFNLLELNVCNMYIVLA